MQESVKEDRQFFIPIVKYSRISEKREDTMNISGHDSNPKSILLFKVHHLNPFLLFAYNSLTQTSLFMFLTSFTLQTRLQNVIVVFGITSPIFRKVALCIRHPYYAFCILQVKNPLKLFRK